MLRQANCVKSVAHEAEFSLHADANESFLVKSVVFADALTTAYPVFRVDRKTVGCYRGGAQGVQHLGGAVDAYIPMNLMDWLMSKGINMSIPVAEGQTFTITRAAKAGALVVIYDIYDASDILATMVNGAESKEYNFVQYMTASEVLAASQDYLLSVSLSPAEFPDFPCGKVVPAKATIDILGIVGMPVNVGDAVNSTSTTYLKLVKDREILFDEDRNGIPFEALAAVAAATTRIISSSLIGDCVSIGATLSDPSYGVPLLFDPPLHFVSGEELLVYLTTLSDDSTEIPVADVRVAMIMNVKTE
ncbi:hypothetical protein ES705_14352 [subsurface metagenome]